VVIRVPDATEPAQLSRSLTHRFENLKSKYRRDLEPMIAERQALQREIYELKQAKDLCLEETTALTSRNDELLELNVSMTRQLENLQSTIKRQPSNRKVSKPTPLPPLAAVPSATPSASGTQSASVAYAPSITEEKDDSRYNKGAKSDSEASNTLRKWFKGIGPNPGVKALAMSPLAAPEKPKAIVRHNFQQQSALRFARCDYCGDKMWGTQLRCSNCPTAVHTRCIGLLNTPCQEVTPREDKDVVEIGPLRTSDINLRNSY
jgi:Rho-type GTPase-activating protein 1/2